MTPFPSTVLHQLIEHHLPGTNGHTQIEPILTGLFNLSYFIHTNQGDYVLRIAPPRDTPFIFYERDMMLQEPEIHQIVASKTDTPVADIIALDRSYQHIERDYILMRRLPGHPLSMDMSTDRNDVLRQVGHYLSQVHRIKTDKYGYLGAHHPMPPQPRWVDAFHLMWSKLIEDIVYAGCYSPDEGDYFRRLLDRQIKLFDHKVSSSLLHMDIWDQNILVDDQGNVSGLVDWDRALWGDPEIEFAVLDYCGISVPSFWEGYGIKRDLSYAARIRQIFYFLYELQKYLVIEQGRKKNPRAANAYKQHVMEVVHRYF